MFKYIGQSKKHQKRSRIFRTNQKNSFLEKDEVEWSTYEKDLDEAFNKVCTKSQEEVIGFKAMYDQIPQKFLKDGK